MLVSVSFIVYVKSSKSIFYKENPMYPSQTAASYEVVYTTLKKRILYLELVPGTLVSETETAKEFSVSRTPVRDAFKALVNEGLLEVRPHIGTFVTLIDINDILSLLYIREVMEKAILKELALSFNQSQEFQLRHILHNQKTLIENTSLTPRDLAMAFANSDDDFHKTLCSLTGKAHLFTYFQMINVQYERFRAFLNLNNTSMVNHFYLQHLKLLDCIKNKDLNRLDLVLTQHAYDGFNNNSNLIYQYPDFFNISR